MRHFADRDEDIYQMSRGTMMLTLVQGKRNIFYNFTATKIFFIAVVVNCWLPTSVKRLRTELVRMRSHT